MKKKNNFLPYYQTNWRLRLRSKKKGKMRANETRRNFFILKTFQFSDFSCEWLRCSFFGSQLLGILKALTCSAFKSIFFIIQWGKNYYSSQIHIYFLRKKIFSAQEFLRRETFELLIDEEHFSNRILVMRVNH